MGLHASDSLLILLFSFSVPYSSCVARFNRVLFLRFHTLLQFHNFFSWMGFVFVFYSSVSVSPSRPTHRPFPTRFAWSRVDLLHSPQIAALAPEHQLDHQANLRHSLLEHFPRSPSLSKENHGPELRLGSGLLATVFDTVVYSPPQATAVFLSQKR
jgi:hypothetical protein